MSESEGMKVLYITNYDTMYGANKSLFSMMELLKEKYNVQPYLLVPGHEGGAIGRLCKTIGVPCLTYDFRISAVSEDMKKKRIHKMTRAIMRYYDFYSIAKQIEKSNYEFDLVHSNSSIFDIGFFLANRWGIPHIWHIREFAKEDYGLETVLTKRTIRKNYLQSDKIIAISDAIKEYVEKYGKDIDIARVYNGIDIIPQYEKEYLVNGKVSFCVVGSLVKGKNQIDVLKACTQLEKKADYDYHVYFLGGTGGKYYDELCCYIREYKEIEKKVSFEGYCDDVNAFLRKMDVGIMPSEREGFGRVTVEYMGNYMPVIASNSGANKELVGETDDIYELHDIDELAKMMEKYITNPGLLFGKGKEMRARALSFTKEQNAENIYNIYREVTN